MQASFRENRFVARLHLSLCFHALFPLVARRLLHLIHTTGFAPPADEIKRFQHARNFLTFIWSSSKILDAKF